MNESQVWLDTLCAAAQGGHGVEFSKQFAATCVETAKRRGYIGAANEHDKRSEHSAGKVDRKQVE